MTARHASGSLAGGQTLRYPQEPVFVPTAGLRSVPKVPAKDMKELQGRLKGVRETLGIEVKEVTAVILDSEGNVKETHELSRHNGVYGWRDSRSAIAGTIGPDAVAINTYVSRSGDLQGIAEDSTIGTRSYVALGGHVKGVKLFDSRVDAGVTVSGPLEVHGKELQMPGEVTRRTLGKYLSRANSEAKKRRRAQIAAERPDRAPAVEQLPPDY